MSSLNPSDGQDEVGVGIGNPLTAQTITLPAGQAITIVNAVGATPTPTPTPPTPTPTPPTPPSPTSIYPRPTVAFINQTSPGAISDAQIQTIMAALQIQVDRDFAPRWFRGASLIFVPKGQTPPPDAWQMVFLDNSDVANALGYHDYTPKGNPLGKVFVLTDQKYGLQTSVTTSHELLEMLADPKINELRGPFTYNGQPAIFACEVGDPVEADALGYQINGVPVSDFALPSYFEPGDPAPYSFVGTIQGRAPNINAPLTLSKGGYFSYLLFTSQKGWQQVQAQNVQPGERVDEGHPRYNPQPGSRREKRNRVLEHGRESLKRSTQ